MAHLVGGLGNDGDSNPPKQSHASYEASALPPSHHVWVDSLLLLLRKLGTFALFELPALLRGLFLGLTELYLYMPFYVLDLSQARA